MYTASLLYVVTMNNNINFSMILSTFHFCTTHVTKSWGIWCLINKLKCWKYNNCLLSIFLFLTRTAWMFACNLWCSRKTLPCVFVGHFPLIFVEITYANLVLASFYSVNRYYRLMKRCSTWLKHRDLYLCDNRVTNDKQNRL